MKYYLVGGAVRDQLLGLPVKEKDWVVVGETAEKMLSLHYQPVGKDFPVFLHPETKEEYALARTERKEGRGYRGFVCATSVDVTLEEDLLRRDLTINAIAMDEKGKLIDPYGGEKDIKAKVLRHVSPAFEEDPVRILRIARFAARFHHLGFHVAAETKVLLKKMVRDGLANDLVIERVWTELVKSLSEKTPAVFFQVLRECGALKILIPELDALFGVPNPPKWHPEIDSGWHTYSVLAQAVRLSDSPCVRFAALVHDLGKGSTPLSIWPSHRGHEERGAEAIQQLGKRMKVPKAYQALAILTSRFHSLVHKAFELKPETILELFEKADAFRRHERFLAMLMVCKADARGRTGHEEDEYPQQAYLTRILLSLRSFSVQQLVDDKTLNGDAIAQALHQARIKVIEQCNIQNFQL
jgi:tRNA nucleotidyltransferase (CCA-adding enzyme)